MRGYKKIRRIVNVVFILVLGVFIYFTVFNHNYNIIDEISSKFNKGSDTGTFINNTLLVNRSNKITEKYVPNDLVLTDLPTSSHITNEEKYISKSIEKDLKELFNGAKKSGYKLYILSGYRSYTTQKNLYEQRVKQTSKERTDLYTAKPGASEHQTGLAVDLTNSSENFTGSKEAAWLEKHCYEYGFILRYPKGKEKVTGYNYEAWHIRYVGRDKALEIQKSGLTLEEYLKQ